MFDVGIGAPDEFQFPSCAKIAISVSQPVIRRESEAERARDHPPKTPLDQLVDALRQLVTQIHEPEDTPNVPMQEVARICDGDFEFPPGPYAMIALRFVQAILVTFPSQILYARWATLRDAQRDLHSRAIAAQKALDRNDDRGAAALAHLLRALPDPPDDRPSTRFGALVPRDDHHDHWHVSYRPEDVEAPDAARVEAIAWIEENRDRLWPP
jgi:hypothetical protein